MSGRAKPPVTDAQRVLEFFADGDRRAIQRNAAGDVVISIEDAAYVVLVEAFCPCGTLVAELLGAKDGRTLLRWRRVTDRRSAVPTAELVHVWSDAAPVAELDIGCPEHTLAPMTPQQLISARKVEKTARLTARRSA